MEQHRFCTDCGAALFSSMRFCGGCGTPVPAASTVGAASAPLGFNPPPPEVSVRHGDGAGPTAASPALAPVGSLSFSPPDAVPAALHAPPTAAPVPTAVLPQQKAGPGNPRTPPPAEAAKATGRGPRGRSRWLLPIAAGAVVILVAGIVAATLWQRAQDRPALAAWKSGEAAFAEVMDQLASAETIDAVNAAGRSAGGAQEVVGEQAAVLSSEGELDGVVVGALTSRAALLSAVAPLADLDESTLSTWADISPGIDAAVAQVEASTDAMAEVDETLADGATRSTAAAEQVDLVVGRFAATAMELNLVELLDDLSSATVTADVQAVAAGAAELSAVADTTGQALVRGSDEAEQVAASAAVLAPLRELAGLDAEHLDAWQPVRGPLQQGLAGVTVARAAGARAIANLNSLVAGAEQSLADWQVAYDRAAGDQERAAKALRRYESGARAQLKVYSSLRGDASEFFDRVETSYVTWDEAFTFLDSARWQRESVRDTLLYMAVPDSMTSAHDGLIAVVDRAIVAVQSGYDGIDDAYNCRTDCNYRETPAWQRFSSESAEITDMFSRAETRWNRALEQETSSQEAQVLPRKPVV